jgi:CRP-like cAMP-binding protein
METSEFVVINKDDFKRFLSQNFDMALAFMKELVRRLREEGHEVTQSSISRDLRDLGVLKAGGRYLPPEDGNRSLDDFGTLRQFVRGVATAGSDASDAALAVTSATPCAVSRQPTSAACAL